MNKTKYLLTTLSLFIMLPSITYAECTSEEIKHFKEIEDEYKYSYEFDSQTKKYTISFHSEEPEKYKYSIIDIENMDCTIDNEKEFTCHNVSPGEYQIMILGTSDNCRGLLKKEKIKLAKYNEYSDDPLCEGIEEFVLCQKTYDKDIDYDTFVSRANTYKKTKQKQENEVSTTKNKNSKIISFVEENSFKIVLFGIFSIVVIISIAMTIKTVKKSRRLE